MLSLLLNETAVEHLAHCWRVHGGSQDLLTLFVPCVFFSLFSSSGHLCVGFTLCSGPLRLRGSYSDGSVSLGLQPHGENPGGLSVRGERKVKISLFGLCWTLTR